MTIKDYSYLDKLLHYIALRSRLMRRVAFDMDCLLAGTNFSEHPAAKPVYIAGLARAGTSILLEALYSTGAFTTLTYRNMPFVTAPLFWTRLSANHRHGATLRERAHGDRMYVGFDSPEAFEEVFWITITEGRYIDTDGLATHEVNQEALALYVRYVSNILAADRTPNLRYLAKNNNNVLRISSLRRALPDTIILVPFRNPYDHACSLLKQHHRFIKIHTEDPFALRYMNWLGHFEFGANLKPFKVNDSTIPCTENETLTLKYWLRYWTSVYNYLLTDHSDHVIFLDYDKFCADPAHTLDRLATAVDLEPIQIEDFADRVQPSISYTTSTNDFTQYEKSEAVYSALCEHSLQNT